MLLEALVILCAVTGALSGLLALALYLVDRRTVRATMGEARVFLTQAKAALNVPGPDGKPLPPLQAAVSMGSSVLVNAAYALINDPELMARAKPLIMEALPAIASSLAQAEPSNPGQALARKRWDRGGAIPKVAKVAGLGKVGEMLEMAQAAKELMPLLQGFKGTGGPGAPGPSGNGGNINLGGYR